MEQVCNLTVRQIYFMYYRERDKQGKPKQLPYYFATKQEKINDKIQMIKGLGKQLNKTDEEIAEMIKKVKEEGNI